MSLYFYSYGYLWSYDFSVCFYLTILRIHNLRSVIWLCLCLVTSVGVYLEAASLSLGMEVRFAYIPFSQDPTISLLFEGFTGYGCCCCYCYCCSPCEWSFERVTSCEWASPIL
ncbi:hypothetical protein Hanom_Chr00s009197g01742511 [Helianthus anomalus]